MDFVDFLQSEKKEKKKEKNSAISVAASPTAAVPLRSVLRSTHAKLGSHDVHIHGGEFCRTCVRAVACVTNKNVTPFNDVKLKNLKKNTKKRKITWFEALSPVENNGSSKIICRGCRGGVGKVVSMSDKKQRC